MIFFSVSSTGFTYDESTFDLAFQTLPFNIIGISLFFLIARNQRRINDLSSVMARKSDFKVAHSLDGDLNVRLCQPQPIGLVDSNAPVGVIRF